MAAVVKRILEQWSALQLFFSEKKLVDRLHSVEHIHNTLSDPFSKLYFLFLDYILPKVTKMNEYFQSDKVLIADLYATIVSAYKEILLCFLNRSYVECNEISNIEPDNKSEFLDINVVYLGVNVLNQLNSEEIIRHPELKKFF